MKGIQSVDEEMITGFERITANFPDNTAIIFLGKGFSYFQLKELIYRFATALSELGVRPNDKVMIYLSNCPQWLIVFFATQKIGAIPVATSPIYTPSEISYQLNDSEAETIICHDTNFGYVKGVLATTGLKRIIVTNIVDLLPWWKRIVGRSLDRIPRGTVEKGKEIYFFRDLLSHYPPKPPKVEINPRDHLAYILYTGGTTGAPKGVPGTHSGLVCGLKDGQDMFNGFISEGDMTYLALTPLFHIVGIGTLLQVGLNLGNRSVIMPQPLVDAILEAIQKYRVDMFFGVPALYRMILENRRLSLYDLSSLKYCWSGGDVLPGEVFNRFKRLTGCPIHQIYGSTESGMLALTPLGEEPAPKKLGKTIPSKEVRVVDPETLESVPMGETGELIVTSPFSKAYLNKPEDTARSFVGIEGKKWYRTGDYVQLDGKGNLYYIDRKADIIKHQGYTISASEIEAILQDHEGVIGACVVGVPETPRWENELRRLSFLEKI